MAQSVKLADDIMALVRREADVQGRSVAGQITHWLKLGRAIEHSGTFDYGRITEVLEGKIDPAELGDGEGAVWLDAFTAKMSEPSEREHAFFERRRKLGLGAGLDAGGNLVRASDETAA